MLLNKEDILKKHCYTELVYQRINKKLVTVLSKKQIENLIYKLIKETDLSCFEKIGKNFYISSKTNNIKITVNSNTYRVITVNKI